MNRANKALGLVCALLLFGCLGYIASVSTDVPDMNIQKSFKASAPATVDVKIEGCVKNEGIYTANIGITYHDAIYMAGGITPNADVSDINMQKLVTSDCRIFIPESKTRPSLAEADISFSSDAEHRKCNINTASAEYLAELDGIGKKIAERIVEYRSANGNFRSIQDLLKIKGIGKATYTKFKDYITVGGE